MTKTSPAKRSIKFILAEDIRNESDGKFSLLGVFPGERFAIGGEPPPGLTNAAFFIQSLIFLFIISGGDEGKHPGHFKIIGPDKKTVVMDTPINQPVEIMKGRSAVFVSGLKPFLGPAFGTYTAQLQIGGNKYKFPFTIEKAPTKKS
jgi:hypothetical protein